MAGLAHDVLIQALREDAALLPALMAKLTGRPLSVPLEPIDSAVRFTGAIELRPDVVYRAGPRWLACEVQNKVDEEKARSWLMAVAVLRFEHRCMGDLVVITASRSVARWAAKVAHERGPVGTRSHLTPVILWLDPRRAIELLDPERPELALCAAWAMKSRHGGAALRIVSRAFSLSDSLPPPLRQAQRHAIMQVLSDRMRSYIQEVTMHPDRFPETAEDRNIRLFLESIESEGKKRGLAKGLAEGLAEGLLNAKREDLMMILTERGLAVTGVARKRIQSCTDSAQLDAWMKRALVATSLREVLSVEESSRPARKKAPARITARTSKSPSRKPRSSRA